MANVKHKENGEWVKIGETPLSTPINITKYLPIPLPENIQPGNTPVLISNNVFVAIESGSSGNYQNTGISVTIPKAGDYKFAWGSDKSGGAVSRLYKNGTAIGSEHSGSSQLNIETEILYGLSEGDIISLWIKPYVYSSRYYYGGVGGLTASISWPQLEALLQ